MKKNFILFLCFPFLCFAYTGNDVSNASFLSTQSIISPQSSDEGYRLDDSITRAEAIGIALKLKDISLPSDYQCRGFFSDVKNNDWICRAMELAAENGLISRKNTIARPQSPITRSEVLGIVSDIAGFRATSEEIAQNTFENPTYQAWQKKVFHRFFSNQIIPQDSVIKYNQYPSSSEKYIASIEYFPNKNATRKFMFDVIKKSYRFHDGRYFFPRSFLADNQTIYNMLQGTGVTVGENKISSTTEINKDSFYFGDWKYGLTEYQQHFYVDNYGPILDEIVGLVTVNGVKFLKGYMYGMCGTTTYITYTKTSVITFQYSCDEGDFTKDIQYLNFKTEGWYFGARELLRLYYGNLATNRYMAYNMRSPAGVSEQTFNSWYQGVTDIVFREDTMKSAGDNTYEFFVDMTENGVKSTYKVKSKVDLENFKINNISSVKQ